MSGARLDTVCRYICEKSSWTMSNLRLQKLLYLAQMFYMGENDGQRLVEVDFQAWDYGPVSPELYRKAKEFGARAIAPEAFPEARRFQDEDPRKKALDAVCDKFLGWTGGQLVSATHWRGGAWAKHYQPGFYSIRIPDKDIKGEYDARAVAGRAARERKKQQAA